MALKVGQKLCIKKVGSFRVACSARSNTCRRPALIPLHGGSAIEPTTGRFQPLDTSGLRIRLDRFKGGTRNRQFLMTLRK